MRRIPERPVPGKPLGRHVRHDPRSLAYPFKAATVTLVSKRHSRYADLILDQGNVGSCTGNATTAALICSNFNPLHDALNYQQKATLNEALAVKIYSRATETDPFQGTYPPTDTGSDGLDVAKAAKEFGYISGYTHALTLQDVLAALTIVPVIIGIEWVEGFDNPDSSGRVLLTGATRGGHEVCLDEIDVEKRLVWFRNSWSDRWGINGRACMSWDDLGRLLSRQGDATVFVPLSQPAPEPVPTPTPVPVDADHELLAAVVSWVVHKKCSSKNEKVRQGLLKWRATKGL